MIELVVVIVILGILAATALPKFVDLSNEAGAAATKGVSGALASGTAVNYAAKAAGKKKTVGGVASDDFFLLNGDNAATCTAANATRFVSGVAFIETAGANTPDADTYRITAGTGSCTDNPGGAVKCTIQGYKGDAYQATVICTGP